MASRKEQRRIAIEREKYRRYEVALSECPIGLGDYENLINHVSDRIVEDGHANNFCISTAYLESAGLPVRAVLEFLARRKMSDDWGLFMYGDPYGVFGPRDGLTSRMPLEEAALTELVEWLDSTVPEVGCDNTHKLTTSWLRDHGMPVTRALGALMVLGGGCDCEVALNIDPESIYTHGNSE